MRVVEENHCFGVFLCERGERATGRTPGHMYINHYRLGEKKLHHSIEFVLLLNQDFLSGISMLQSVGLAGA
jgi:hypothetical protein